MALPGRRGGGAGRVLRAGGSLSACSSLPLLLASFAAGRLRLLRRLLPAGRRRLERRGGHRPPQASLRLRACPLHLLRASPRRTSPGASRRSAASCSGARPAARLTPPCAATSSKWCGGPAPCATAAGRPSCFAPSRRGLASVGGASPLRRCVDPQSRLGSGAHRRVRGGGCVAPAARGGRSAAPGHRRATRGARADRRAGEQASRVWLLQLRAQRGRRRPGHEISAHLGSSRGRRRPGPHARDSEGDGAHGQGSGPKGGGGGGGEGARLPAEISRPLLRRCSSSTAWQ